MTPDPDGLRYARHWEPVLAGPACRLLARLEVVPALFLDVGAGTGGSALAAAERWPKARIMALDASAGMLSVGKQRVAAERPGDTARFEWLVADARAMPLADGSVDVVASSFVLSLVDDRPALLREMWRVLRPGGTVALVTWLADDGTIAADEVTVAADGATMAADVAFERLVAERGWARDRVDFRHSRATDYVSLAEVERELAATGFTQLEVRADEVRFRWTRGAYLAFKEEYDERDLWDSHVQADRDRFRHELRARLATLPDSAFELRAQLVTAVARRPAQAASGVLSSGRQDLQGR